MEGTHELFAVTVEWERQKVCARRQAGRQPSGRAGGPAEKQISSCYIQQAREEASQQ